MSTGVIFMQQSIKAKFTCFKEYLVGAFFFFNSICISNILMVLPLVLSAKSNSMPWSTDRLQ